MEAWNDAAVGLWNATTPLQVLDRLKELRDAASRDSTLLVRDGSHRMVAQAAQSKKDGKTGPPGAVLWDERHVREFQALMVMFMRAKHRRADAGQPRPPPAGAAPRVDAAEGAMARAAASVPPAAQKRARSPELGISAEVPAIDPVGQGAVDGICPPAKQPRVHGFFEDPGVDGGAGAAAASTTAAAGDEFEFDVDLAAGVDVDVGAEGQASAGGSANGAAGAGGGAAADSSRVDGTPATAASGDLAIFSKLLPEKLLSSLMPFQLEGLAFGWRHHGRVIIGDDMGLGKTIQAIAVAQCYRAEWPLLVVVPASMKLTWADELGQWLGLDVSEDICVVRSARDAGSVGKKPVTIITYNMFSRDTIVLSKVKAADFQVVVLDESHYIKNTDAKRTRNVMEVARNANRVILLSGTPAMNRPIELYTQLSLVAGTKFGTKHNFGLRYCNARKEMKGGREFWDYSGSSNEKELHTRMQNYMIRRLKKDVLTQLPAKRRSRVRLEISAAASRDLRKQMSAMRSKFDVAKQLEVAVHMGGGGRDASDSLARLDAEQRKLMGEAYVATGEAKVKPTLEFLYDKLVTDSRKKLLVFAHHKAVLDALDAEMSTKRFQELTTSIRIDGSTSSADRHRRVNLFQENPSVRIALLSITAAGQGITLTAADSVVFAELSWVPAQISQAEDRAHRIGQQADFVNIYFLVAAGSIDDIIWDSVQRKMGVVTASVEGQWRRMEAESTKAPSRSGQLRLTEVGARVDDAARSSAGAPASDPSRAPRVDAAAPNAPGATHGRAGLLAYMKPVQEGARAADAQTPVSVRRERRGAAAVDETQSPTVSEAVDQLFESQSSAPRAGGAAAACSPAQWACARCTLINDVAAKRCSACDNPRPN